MLIAVVVLAILCLLLVLYLLALQGEARRMTQTIRRVAETETNSRVFTLTRNRSFVCLAAQINRLLEVQQQRSQAIRQADQAFKESVTGISHDLRTPLTSVSGYLQLLRSDKTSPAKKAEYLDTIERRLGALLALLDELFEYTRVELEQLNLQPERLSLGDVLLDRLTLYYEEFSSRGLVPALSLLQQPVAVFADRNCLERIFQNLIKNALVHGQGELSIAMEREEDWVLVHFANPAPQPPADPQRLFDRFYTADSARSGGTGLGLAIVKQLTEGMGGSVRAKLDGGALDITVRLPVAPGSNGD